MKQEVLLELLEAAAAEAGVKVSYEALSFGSGGSTGVVGHGGLCKLKTASGWQYRVIIDKRATPQERVATLASSLSRVITDPSGLEPKVREALYQHSDRDRSDRIRKAS
jgi:hypothetical protein